MANEYVCVVGADQIGPAATEADLEEFCELSTAWLTEHEGDDLSIMVRAVRRGEVTGTFRVRQGIPSGPDLHGSSEEEDVRVRELLDQCWELYCAGQLGGLGV